MGFLRIGNFTGRRLQLNDRDRQAINKHHNIGTFGGITVYDRPLIGNNKWVVVYINEVYYFNMVTAQCSLVSFERNVQAIL